MLKVLFQRDVLAFTKISTMNEENSFSPPRSLNYFKAFIHLSITEIRMPFNASNKTHAFTGNLSCATWMKVNLCIHKNVLECHRLTGTQPTIKNKRLFLFLSRDKK